jgi:hypothetical protein
MNACYGASKSMIGKMGGNKQPPRVVNSLLSTYTLSVVLLEHALVFFISAIFAQDCFFR